MQALSALRRSRGRPTGHDADATTRAFAELYRNQCGRVYAFLRYRLGDAALAEDLTAEAFARAWSSWTRTGPPPADGAATAWLFVTARNLATDHHRSRRPTCTLEEVPPEREATSGSPEREVLAAEGLARLDRCLAELGEREREVLGLRLVAGLRNREIAGIVGTTEGNVAKIIHRALQKVRTRMNEEETRDA